jgi:selenobiotic family peptide radical SAM maturase
MGNPVSEEQVDAIIKITKPGLYQISLEGLKEHNDFIRGKGSFDRGIEFLTILSSLDVSSGVMLTLTNENIDQVLLLEEILRDKTGFLTYSRLSKAGEGELLNLPQRGKYVSFLSKYLNVQEKSSILSVKDNLLNIVSYKKNKMVFPGCVGFGCSPAFNILSILPDGEVHACRKFPSLIGNINKKSLSQIYDSRIAKKYRRGNSSCRKCSIKPVCGGCMAVIRSCGLDIFKDRDPYCFI